VDFEWDDAKARSNLLEHGVDFLDAIEAVLDPNRLEDVDNTSDYRRGAPDRHWNGARPRSVRGHHASRRGRLQDHLGPKGHAT
jgi:uncharacterized DUF497 family protein